MKSSRRREARSVIMKEQMQMQMQILFVAKTQPANIIHHGQTHLVFFVTAGEQLL